MPALTLPDPATLESTFQARSGAEGLVDKLEELVRGYLGSPHALEWLKAEGALPKLRKGHLERLPVPQPKKEVLEALEGLAEAERVYRGWGDEAREAPEDLEVSVAPAVKEEPVQLPGGVETEEEEEALMKLDDWVSSRFDRSGCTPSGEKDLAGAQRLRSRVSTPS